MILCEGRVQLYDAHDCVMGPVSEVLPRPVAG